MQTRVDRPLVLPPSGRLRLVLRNAYGVPERRWRIASGSVTEVM